ILMSLIIIWNLNFIITTIFFFMSTTPLFLWLLSEKYNITINSYLKFFKSNQLINFYNSLISAIIATIIGLAINKFLEKKDLINADNKFTQEANNNKQLIVRLKDKEIINYISNSINNKY
ncbi:membrane protein, partial [Candidatus Magnetomorum sp. HK-1]